METKILEIRDRGTYFAVLCIDMQPDDDAARYHMRRVGYPCDGVPNIAMTMLNANGDPFWNDPYGWSGARTKAVAHNYIIEHWHELKNGDVVCLETILGERTTPKVSERFE